MRPWNKWPDWDIERNTLSSLVVFQAACWAHPIKRGKAWGGGVETTLWFFWSGGGRVFPYTQHSRTRTRPEKLVCKISPLDVSIPESWSFSSTCCAVSGRNVMSLTLQESINNAVSSLFTSCQHLFTLEEAKTLWLCVSFNMFSDFPLASHSYIHMTREQAEWLLLFTIVRQHCFCLNLTCFVLFASFIKYV